MTTQTKLPQSIFPDYPREQPLVDKQGNLIAHWDLQLSALFQALQKNYKNEGIVFPPLTQTQMDTIAALYSGLINMQLPQTLPDISGQTVFNLTTRSPYQFIITYDASSPPKIASAGWIQFSMLVTFAGDPNGHVGGALNWICFNTVGSTIYVCTTAGSANGTPSPQAVWTGINSVSSSFLLL